MHVMTTVNSFEDFVICVQAYLTSAERDGSVAYGARTELPLDAGTQLQFPGTVIQVKTKSWLAFVDREPMANWGHPARYLLVSTETGEILSVEARLPPFQSGGELRWHVIYKAPSVPDAAVASSQ
jgi:hypothetical protein